MPLTRLVSGWHRLFGQDTARDDQRRRTRPLVEELETRTVPTVFANQAYVSSLYQGLLGRNPDQAGQTFWSTALNNGATREQVVSGFLNSSEYRGRAVEVLYQSILQRPGDLQGLTAFSNTVHGGTSLDEVRAQMLGSDEFFNKAGGNKQGFINLLSQTALGRPADQNVQDAINNGLDNNDASDVGDRTEAARDVLKMDEVNRDKVNDLFQTALGRSADPLGLSAFTGALRSGLPEQLVDAQVFASDEYFLEVVNGAGGANSTGNATTTLAQFITSNNLFLTGTQASAFMRLYSPAYGQLPLPAGYDQLTPNTGLGTFGANGFSFAGTSTSGTSGTTSTSTSGTTTGTTGTTTTGTTSTGTTTTGTTTSPTQTGINTGGFPGATTTTTGVGTTGTGTGTTGTTGTGTTGTGTTTGTPITSGTGTGGGTTGAPAGTGTTATGGGTTGAPGV